MWEALQELDSYLNNCEEFYDYITNNHTLKLRDYGFTLDLRNFKGFPIDEYLRLELDDSCEEEIPDYDKEDKIDNFIQEFLYDSNDIRFIGDMDY
jgi:hypothetical protein